VRSESRFFEALVEKNGGGGGGGKGGGGGGASKPGGSGPGSGKAGKSPEGGKGSLSAIGKALQAIGNFLSKQPARRGRVSGSTATIGVKG
jgi:hypothetical protein